MASRSPSQRWCSTRVPPGPSTATYTVPTGFCGVPPPGPAIPVVASPQSVPNMRRTPLAIARATSALTAPWAVSAWGLTPRARTFAMLA